MEELNRRIAAAEKRLEVVEAKVNDPVERVKRDLAVKKIYNARFVTVHSKYYELSLEERASLMHCNVPQLCKSIIFENTMCDHNDMNDVTNSRYYIVIIQYITKISTAYLETLIQGLRPPETRLPRKKFHFRLASEEDNARLSGFEHNGIAPFGLHEKIPMVISDQCLNVTNPAALFLGGGKPDVKLVVPIQDLVRAGEAIVGRIVELK